MRGNHYHPLGIQYIYILEGELISYSLRIKSTGFTHSIKAMAGDLLYCPPMVAHAYRFLLPTAFVNIDTVPRGDGEHYEDTKAFQVIG